MDRRPKLSKRRQQIYDYLCSYTKEHGYPPSIREICNFTTLKSTSTVSMHLDKLESDGYIYRDPNKPRALEIVGLNPYSDVEDVLESSTLELPLVDNILEVENATTKVSLPAQIICSRSTFVKQVKTDFMREENIFKGDYVVVKETTTFTDGDLVAVIKDKDAFIAKYKVVDDKVKLIAHDRELDAFNEQSPIILGRITGLIRSFN